MGMDTSRKAGKDQIIEDLRAAWSKKNILGILIHMWRLGLKEKDAKRMGS